MCPRCPPGPEWKTSDIKAELGLDKKMKKKTKKNPHLGLILYKRGSPLVWKKSGATIKDENSNRLETRDIKNNRRSITNATLIQSLPEDAGGSFFCWQFLASSRMLGIFIEPLLETFVMTFDSFVIDFLLSPTLFSISATMASTLNLEKM